MASADYYNNRSDSEVGLNEYGKQGSHYTGVAPNMSKLSRGRTAHSHHPARKWIAIGVVALLIVIGAVVGGVVGSNAAKNNSAPKNQAVGAVVTGAASNGVITTVNGIPQYPINGNGAPIYPTSSATAAGSAPTFASNSQLSCGSDPYTGTSNSIASLTVRPDHPRLIAPSYRWSCMPDLVSKDQYLNAWNTTIMSNATKYASMAPQPYTIDGGLGGSGILDPAREVQLRIKHWGYAWRMTNDTQWPQRAWTELQTAAGNNSDVPWGQGATNSIWNTQHFLDLAELTAAFAYAFDWMHDAWTQDQRDAIMWSMINLGLQWGLNSYNNENDNESFGWWQASKGNDGNWNCVCNKGLVMGALAILDVDPTGTAQEVLNLALPNALGGCYQGVQDDGTWTETSDYWYFGSTSAAEMWSSVNSATGFDFTSEVTDANPNYNKTGLFHMYGTGNVQKFDYGDCGPNKYTATANCIMFFGSELNVPMYTLYQRERMDAPEPLSMFWYDPQASGNWWDNLALDHSFTDPNDTWVSMRSSWTDSSGLYTAMKAGKLVGHQTHGDLDIGDFVLDALNQRWAGELCQAQYLSDGYFSSEAQDSERWLYYRKRTEGQNTLLIDYANQNVNTNPTTIAYQSSGDAQTSLADAPGSDSTVFWITDMSTAYSGSTSVQRGIRTLNSRRQTLVQDEVSGAAGDIQWRMHTNATISYSNNNQTASLALGGETMLIQLLSPSNAAFATLQPVRFASDPALPSDSISQDLPNPGVSVLTTTITSSSATIEVLFSPQWSGLSSSDYISPPSVPLSGWTLTSHG